LFEQAQAGEEVGCNLPDREQYADDRGHYIDQGRGTPPADGPG
jgi:hypothetical protein